MTVVSLAPSEWDDLMKLKQDGPHKLIRLKAESMMLLHENVPIEVTARLVGKKPSTIQTWVREWNTQREASLYTGHAGNLNASKLTEAQRLEVVEVLQSPPGPQTLPEGFWSVPDLAQWVYERFDVVYASPTSYHFLLHLAGLSFHKPSPFDQRRASDTDIQARMDEIRAEIQDPLADPTHLVVAADEVRLEHEAITRRAWHQKGAKTKLLVDRKRQARSYIGFLDQNTGNVDLMDMEWQNSTTIIHALDELTDKHPGQQITIIWDNAAWHRSQELRDLLGPGHRFENIHLIWMPPYAPDHNPIEHVWAEAKTNISNTQRATFTETRHAFETYITTNTFPYRITKDLA